MLEIKRVEKSFGGLKAVDDCSLEVRKGTITGLIGPNGAGKTTLFNIITGHFKPDRGKIFFQGEAIEGLAPHQIFKKKVYRTFQITREFTHMTVLENLMIMPEHQLGERIWNTWFRPSTIRDQEKELRDKALEVLEYVELIDLKDEYAGSLSGGQKKLLEIARSMMADPTLVLLDEPGAGVNPTLMRKLIANIESLRDQKGMTFFLIEHDMDLVMNLCDPVIVMSEGTKLAEGSAADIKKDERVLEAYLGGQYR
ncbi:MAG: ABC transporter ATP-binding protein [Desulfobacterales bacterium]|jgi:branched-chain amino acid transport system ATP-binding protein